MLLRTIAIALVFLSIATAVSAASVATSQLGYHPAQNKQAVVYGASGGAFSVQRDGVTVHTGSLQQATCQGGQTCAIGDFTGVTAQGTYRVLASGAQSPQFTIGPNTLGTLAPLLGEFFLATKQRQSPYHADIHGAQSPQFTIQADGSFIQTTDQASLTAIRLARAIERNPQLLSFDRHQVTDAGKADMSEYLKIHIDYLRGLQDHDGTRAVPSGWFFNFGCSLDNNPYEERYMTEPNPCLEWHGDTPADNAAIVLFAYTSAIPAINQGWGAPAAEALLARAQETDQYLQGKSIDSDAAAFHGAALFELFDYTGDASYLTRAHALRSRVNAHLGSHHTSGNEFYWEEYARHKQAMESAGLGYLYNGEDPKDYFASKIENDWNGIDTKHSISETGEKVYIVDIDQDFQHSRAILIEAAIAAKAREIAASEHAKVVMDSQLAFLTGVNNVQQGDGAGPLSSRSFIFGVGNHGVSQHVRLVWPGFFKEGNAFPNGARYIPGWIPGPLDSFNDGDSILNYDDEWHNWRYTETTNEIVAAAVELAAYMDAQYNARVRLARPRLTGDATTCTYNGNTYAPGDSFPKGDGCNTCTCNGDGTVSCTSETCDAPAVCGNGVVESGEACDDGNTASGDGCSSACEVEPDGCFTAVAQLPVSCTGTITLDEFGGCRKVVCESGAERLQVLACDKPDSGSPEYFEMYKQEDSGNLEVCLGNICLKDAGYVKSANYPICVGGGPPDDPVCGNGVVESGEACDDGNAASGDGCSSACEIEDEDGVCYSSVEGIPAECTGGEITQDSFNGCRTIVCSGLQVLACEKPDAGAAQYFEMYKQSPADGIEICLAQTCIAGNGYAKSPNYPVCTGGGGADDPVCGNGVVESGEACDDGNAASGDGCSATCQQETAGTVDLRIKEWYPQGLNVVFVCESPSAPYRWNFGDGHLQMTETDNVYHTYPEAGTYTASCETGAGSDTLTLSVS